MKFRIIPRALTARGALAVFVFVPALSLPAAAQTRGVVTKAMNLRSGPSKTSPRIAGLRGKETVTLLDSKPKNGFRHVRVTRTTEGWVWAQALQPGASNVAHAMGTKKLARRPVSQELEPVTPGLAPAVCAQDLAACPANGCSAAGSAHGLTNRTKRAAPTGTIPVMLTFDDFTSLQQQAADLVGEGREIPVNDRAQLSGLTASAGQVSEGGLVTLVGYLVGTPHSNKKESVNCNLLHDENNDFHIPMSNDPNNTDFQGVVVEMIPQNRPPEWSLSNLTQVESNQQLVMVTGGLFYDNIHRVNGDPNDPQRGQPHRYSLWEVHPITQFVVCTKADNSCDPARPGDWAPLGQ